VSKTVPVIPEVSELDEAALLAWLEAQPVVGFEVEETEAGLLFGFASDTQRVSLRGNHGAKFASWLAAGDKPKILFDLKGTKRLLLEHALDVAGVVEDALLLAYLSEPTAQKFLC
jgi:DNA polymerase I-like protein with 3'-5' exonuclease and polymerase domains